MHVAVSLGYVETARVLVMAGCRVDATDQHDLTPLHVAALHGHTRIVELLTAHEANINALDDNRLSPLYLAVLKGKYEVKNFEGMTPLMFAVRDSHQQVVKVLLGNHAAVDETERSGFTALQMAISQEYHDIVSDLLENGANVDHVANGDSTLFLAVEKGDCRMVH